MDAKGHSRNIVIKNLSLNDPTQIEIMRHIKVTEELIAKVASKVSGKKQTANVWLMPDLGLPRGIARIHGGFFIGAFYSWQTSKPFVPVDATINSCGVSVYRINNHIESENEFYKLIQKAIIRTKNNMSYLWNFDESNHFVLYGVVEPGQGVASGNYLVLHSSACEFKHQYNGLYPSKGNWYSENIKTSYDENSNRYLRYLDGTAAERFIQTAQMLDGYNRLRHRYFAGAIVGEHNIEQELTNVQHYGMPTSNSIAIGCQWLEEAKVYLLLTDPKSPLFFIRSYPGWQNHIKVDDKEFILAPHGLGNQATCEVVLDYLPTKLIFNRKEYSLQDRLEFGKDIDVRNLAECELDGKENIPATVQDVLSKCPGEIIGRLQQLYNYNRNTASLISTE